MNIRSRAVKKLNRIEISTSAIIMSSEIIKVKTSHCYFQSPRKQGSVLRDQFVVKSA